MKVFGTALILAVVFATSNCYGFEGKDIIFDFTSRYGISQDVSAPFTWTLGIPSLDILIMSDNLDNNTIPSTLVLNIQLKLSNTRLCHAPSIVLYNSGQLFKVSNPSLNETLMMNEPQWQQTKFNVTVSLPITTVDIDNSLIYMEYPTLHTWGNIAIFLEECNITANGTNNQITVIPGGMGAIYNATGNCSCEANNTAMYCNAEATSSKKALCNANAKWSGCQGCECWHAPKNILISQGSNYSDTAVNFSCTYDRGYPYQTKEQFFINNKPVSKDWNLKSSDHNKLYRCEASNNYTRDTGTPPLKSNSGLLVVFFSPKITESTESSKLIELNNSAAVYFYFQANPASGNITTTFDMPNKLPTEKTLEKNSSHVNYNISYTIAINSSADYGYYSFTVRTCDPNGSNTVSIKIVNETVTLTTTASTTTTNTNQETLYIVIGCSGAVVLIIVLVVFLIIYRKRKGKSASDEDIKEERENPLYGSAPGPSANAEYATVDKSKKKQEKEEKVNPIYQGTSAGADADTVEEAYAAIDIKKKKKKKEKNSEGSENSAFDPEATYAAVNKPKKKKNVEPPPDVVYSAVQKKKKNDQPSDTDLHV